MRILVAAATAAEAGPLVDAIGPGRPGRARRTEHGRGAHEVHVLVTGVGMVATAAWCARALTDTPFDLALNVGVCGSFDRALPPGRVVHVISDRVAGLGAEDGDDFLTLEQLRLTDPDDLPFTRAALLNPSPPDNPVLRELPAVAGITVNTVHGNDRSIAAVVARYHPDVESMEGAAFMYACLIHGVPFAQVRAVSNIVERRNRHAWRMAEAIGAAAAAGVGVIEAS
jgi:futalosine hydrolase